MLNSLRHFLTKRPLTQTPSLQSSAARSFHKLYNQDREEQILKLSDGRNIGFAEYGVLNGVPIFYIHGSPGSRYDGAWFLDVAHKLNMRMICPDRPGIGLSSLHQDRRLSDYPKDISQLARYLGIPKYHILGHSGGGPYAIACAYASPKDELLTASVLAGLTHPAGLTMKGDGMRTAALFFLAKWTPNLLESGMKYALADDKNLEKTFDKIESMFMTDEDKAIMSKPENKAMVMASMKASYAQGPRGNLQDLQVCGKWDFELKDVQEQVKLFWGLEDKNALPIDGRYFKDNLPNAELLEYEGMTHFNLDKYEEDIFRTILGIGKSGSDSEPREQLASQ